MTRFRTPFRSNDHLSNYWNARVQGAPSDELARLARLVEPDDLAAIEQAHAAHQRHEPDPVFALSLEQALLDTVTPHVPDAAFTPHPETMIPSWNSPRNPAPISHRRALPRQGTRGTSGSISFARIALALLLVLATAGGTWWLANRDGEPQWLIAPDSMESLGPADYSDHPIVGAWQSETGHPNWTLTVFTSDGIIIASEPYPTGLSPDEFPPSGVSMGLWYPASDRSIEWFVRVPAPGGGYLERWGTWEVSEDGTSISGVGSWRQTMPNGAILEDSMQLQAVRMTAPDAPSDSTPLD